MRRSHVGGEASPQTRDVDAAGGTYGVTRMFLRPLRGLREEWVVSLGVPLRSTPSYVPVPPPGRNIGTGGLAEKLIESLDTEPGPELSPAWREEVRRRCREVDEGLVALRDAEDFFTRAHSELGEVSLSARCRGRGRAHRWRGGAGASRA